MNAQIAKTYNDGTVDILTLPIEAARAHVRARVVAPHLFGLTKISVSIEGVVTVMWEDGKGWFKRCDNAEVEHAGFPCAHPVN